MTSQDTASALLATLRRETGLESLDFAGGCEPVPGGNETTIYGFALNLPEGHALAGALIARIYFQTRNALQHRVEGLVHARLAAAGFPVPAVRFVCDGDGVGAPWILMDRLPGAMLGSEGLRMPWGVLHFHELLRSVPERLAALHLQMHAVAPAPLREGLAALTGDATAFTPAGQIRNARGWLGDDRDTAAALRIMEARLPDTREAVICHGDFHPLNVLGDRDAGYAVIDWGKICFGPREFDVGSTLALLELTALNLPSVVRRVAEWVKFKMGVRYVDAYRAAGHTLDREQLRYFYALRALLELIYLRTHGVPEVGDIGGWEVRRLLGVITRFTGVRMTA